MIIQWQIQITTGHQLIKTLSSTTQRLQSIPREKKVFGDSGLPDCNMQKAWVRSLGWEDPLEKEMAISLQYSCLGKPMDRRSWGGTVHGAAKSRTWLKRLSMRAQWWFWLSGVHFFTFWWGTLQDFLRKTKHSCSELHFFFGDWPKDFSQWTWWRSVIQKAHHVSKRMCLWSCARHSQRSNAGRLSASLKANLTLLKSGAWRKCSLLSWTLRGQDLRSGNLHTHVATLGRTIWRWHWSRHRQI